MKYNEVKDSGKREGFTTGAVRDTQEGKGRYDLLPFQAIERLAIHYENGAKKYGDHNWRKGMPLMRYFSSAMRHMFRWVWRYTDEDHLAAAIWNLCSILETEQMIERGTLPSTLDDRYVESAIPSNPTLKEDTETSIAPQDTTSGYVKLVWDKDRFKNNERFTFKYPGEYLQQLYDGEHFQTVHSGGLSKKVLDRLTESKAVDWQLPDPWEEK